MENQDNNTYIRSLEGVHPVLQKVLNKYEKANVNIVGDQADADFSILMSHLLEDLEKEGREAAEKAYQKALRCCDSLESQRRGHAAHVRRRLEEGKTEGQWLMSRCLSQLVSDLRILSQHLPSYGDAY